MALYDLEVLADNPVAYYRDGAADFSGNALTGALTGGVAPGPSALDDDPTSASVHYDAGGHGQLLTPSSPLLDIAAEGAIEAWIRQPGLAFATVRDFSGVPSGEVGWLLVNRISGGSLFDEYHYRVGGIEVATTVDAGAYVDSLFHHYVTEWKAGPAGFSNFYIDGALKFAGPPPGSDPIQLPWTVGKNGELGQWFDGYVDELAFYDHVLGGVRARVHFCAGKPSLCNPWTVGEIRF